MVSRELKFHFLCGTETFISFWLFNFMGKNYVVPENWLFANSQKDQSWPEALILHATLLEIVVKVKCKRLELLNNNNEVVMHIIYICIK